MAKGIHTEHTFETAIEASLLENGGYTKGFSEHFDAQLGFFPKYIIDFLKASQPKSWVKLQNIHKDETEKKVLQRLIKEIELRGLLDVIRKGFTDYGVKFSMAFFKPETTLNPEAEAQYKSNHLSVTRQLYYERVGKNSIDMVLWARGTVTSAPRCRRRSCSGRTPCPPWTTSWSPTPTSPRSRRRCSPPVSAWPISCRPRGPRPPPSA